MDDTDNLALLGDDALVDNPDWTAGGRVHNWRNHIGPRTQFIWASLTIPQRRAIAFDADDRAGNEEWE